MRILILISLWASISMAAPPSKNSHSISPDGSYRPSGRPAKTQHIVALAGKPLDLYWSIPKASEAATIRVDRLTNTRRIASTSGKIRTSETGWHWTWKPPAAKGPAHYEISIKDHPALTLHIETRDTEWFEETKSALSKMQWEEAGFTSKEREALTGLGFKLVKARDVAKDSPALLRMIPLNGALGRRDVTWDNEQHDTVVWAPGTTAGDLRVRTPRWWISPEALATDQGIIRILDLFSKAPNNP